MQNYYEILGLPVTASVGDVKSAFRLLAKRFHPDLNPSGKDQFNNILKAYEVLSDPQKKYAYDYRLSSGAEKNVRAKSSASAESGPKEKNWRFDERELRRRQYYNEHIKKYEKKVNPAAPPPSEAPAYNEFKYILFATPLAVLLFVGIMHFANKQTETGLAGTGSGKVLIENNGALESSLPSAPYTAYFGEGYYDLTSKAELTIRNLTGADAIVCLFDSTRFLRSFLLKEGSAATVPGLPDRHLNLRYCTGRDYDQAAAASPQPVAAAFKTVFGNYKSQNSFNLDAINQLTLLPGINEGFQQIASEDFFRKTL